MTTTHPISETATTGSEDTLYTGPYGTGGIHKLPTGGREVRVEFSDGRKITAESTRVDLEACNAATLSEALYNALHKTNSLPLFEKSVISGKMALVVCFRRPKDPTVGYATIVKKGKAALRFELARIDLDAMKAPDVMKALRTVAWETGTVKLKK